MDLTPYEYEETTRPIAKEIVSLLISKKIDYSHIEEVLKIVESELKFTRPVF